MKKLLIPISFCLLMVTTATAQKTRGGERKQTMQQNRQEMSKQLNLSDDQKNQMKSINKDFKDKATALKDNDAITRGDFKKQMKDLQNQRKSQIDATLSSEQKTKMNELKEAKKTEMKERNEKRFEKMSEKAGLDEKQKTSLKENQQKTQAEIKKIRDDNSLSASQKKEQVKSLMENQKEFRKTILTPEQKEKLKSTKKEKK